MVFMMSWALLNWLTLWSVGGSSMNSSASRGIEISGKCSQVSSMARRILTQLLLCVKFGQILRCKSPNKNVFFWVVFSRFSLYDRHIFNRQILQIVRCFSGFFLFSFGASGSVGSPRFGAENAASGSKSRLNLFPSANFSRSPTIESSEVSIVSLATIFCVPPVPGTILSISIPAKDRQE